jgi:predicted TIM-barrel fold metal-dependent hydrolase
MYDGPVIDAHMHLWDLAVGRYPWLMPNGNFGPKGRLDVLKGESYVLADYRRDAAGVPVVASVHVEALWDPGDDPLAETLWLEKLERDDDLIARYVVGVPFRRPNTTGIIHLQAQFPRVKAVRQTIAWTPSSERRMVPEPDITRDPTWREAIPALLEHNLALELLMYPWQGDNVAELAHAYPELRVIVNHIASPIEQDEAGISRWSDAIARMAVNDNVFIKMSAAAAYVEAPTRAKVAPYLDHVLASFGSARVMFGSDFPVGGLVGWSFREYFDTYRECLRHLDPRDQWNVFFGSASAVYDIQP